MMAGHDELICSEVHTFTSSNKEKDSSVSTFTFVNPIKKRQVSVKKEIEYDSDGDIVVDRRCDQVQEDVVVLHHDVVTPLAGVGRQVWRGSLLLADYLLCNHIKFENAKILELGSGTGLASIVAALCGARVVASDIPGQNILQRIRDNINSNLNILPNESDINVEALDLNTDECSEAFDYILAGDLIYDDLITDAFIQFIHKSLSTYTDTKFVISMEKRFVFTLQDLDTVAPAYDYFMTKLDEISKQIPIQVTNLPTSFEQYFCYDRSREMILIEICRKK